MCTTDAGKSINITILQPSETYLCGYKSSYMRIPYRMKIYTELNLVTWLKMVEIWNQISADLQLSIPYNMIKRYISNNKAEFEFRGLASSQYLFPVAYQINST